MYNNIKWMITLIIRLFFLIKSYANHLFTLHCTVLFPVNKFTEKKDTHTQILAHHMKQSLYLLATLAVKSTLSIFLLLWINGLYGLGPQHIINPSKLQQYLLVCLLAFHHQLLATQPPYWVAISFIIKTGSDMCRPSSCHLGKVDQIGAVNAAPITSYPADPTWGI